MEVARKAQTPMRVTVISCAGQIQGLAGPRPGEGEKRGPWSRIAEHQLTTNFRRTDFPKASPSTRSLLLTAEIISKHVWCRIYQRQSNEKVRRD